MPFFSRKEAPAPINLSDMMEENEYDRPKRNRYGISSSQGGKLRRKRVTRNKRRYGRKSRKHGRKSRRH
jgi:hypothetical protein